MRPIIASGSGGLRLNRPPLVISNARQPVLLPDAAQSRFAPPSSENAAAMIAQPNVTNGGHANHALAAVLSANTAPIIDSYLILPSICFPHVSQILPWALSCRYSSLSLNVDSSGSVSNLSFHCSAIHACSSSGSGRTPVFSWIRLSSSGFVTGVSWSGSNVYRLDRSSLIDIRALYQSESISRRTIEQ